MLLILLLNAVSENSSIFIFLNHECSQVWCVNVINLFWLIWFWTWSFGSKSNCTWYLDGYWIDIGWILLNLRLPQSVLYSFNSNHSSEIRLMQTIALFSSKSFSSSILCRGHLTYLHSVNLLAKSWIGSLAISRHTIALADALSLRHLKFNSLNMQIETVIHLLGDKSATRSQ